jgi:hypothetical protein
MTNSFDYRHYGTESDNFFSFMKELGLLNKSVDVSSVENQMKYHLVWAEIYSEKKSTENWSWHHLMMWAELKEKNT